MKVGIYLTLFFLLCSPFQGEALSCCFIDLFCSRTCVAGGMFTGGYHRFRKRDLRSMFALRRAYDLAPEGQINSDLLSRVTRNIHINKIAQRLFAPTQPMSREQALSGTRTLGHLRKIAASH